MDEIRSLLSLCDELLQDVTTTHKPIQQYVIRHLVEGIFKKVIYHCIIKYFNNWRRVCSKKIR